MRSFNAIVISGTLLLGIDPTLLQARIDAAATPTTPIQHVIAIFGENISFDK